MKLIWHSFEHVLEELPGSASVSRYNALDGRELGCAFAARSYVLVHGQGDAAILSVNEGAGALGRFIIIW